MFNFNKFSFVFLASFSLSAGLSGCGDTESASVDSSADRSPAGLDVDEVCDQIMDIKVNGPKLVHEGESVYEYIWQPKSETRASEFDDLWEDLHAVRRETSDEGLRQYLSSWMQVTETRANLLRTQHDLGDVLDWGNNETGIVAEEAEMVELDDTYRDRCR